MSPDGYFGGGDEEGAHAKGGGQNPYTGGIKIMIRSALLKWKSEAKPVAVYTNPTDADAFSVLVIVELKGKVYQAATFDTRGRFDGLRLENIDDILAVEWGGSYLDSLPILEPMTTVVRPCSGSIGETLSSFAGSGQIVKVLLADWTEVFAKILAVDDLWLHGVEIELDGQEGSQFLRPVHRILGVEYGSPEIDRLTR